MKKPMYYFFAILACSLEFIIHISLGVLLFNWESGGGTLPMLLLFGVMIFTWKFIVGLYKEPISENDINQGAEFLEVYDKDSFTYKEREAIIQFKKKLKEGYVIVKHMPAGYIKVISKDDYSDWVKQDGNNTMILLVEKK